MTHQNLELTNPITPTDILQPKRDVTTLVKGASVSLGGKMLGKGSHFLGQIILARLLGPEIFGLYALGWTLLSIAGVIAPLGLEKGVIRFGSRYWGNDPAGLRGVLFRTLGFALLSGVTVGGGIFLISPWLAEQVFQDSALDSVLRLFALALPFLVGLRVAAAATRVSQRMKFAVYSEEIGQPVANLILVLMFFLLGWRLYGTITATVISFVFAFALAFYYVKRLYPEAFSAPLTSGLSTKELIIFSFPTALAGVFTMLTIWTDRLFIGYFRPTIEVGIYQAFSQTSLLFAIILAAMNSIFSPLIADLYHKKDLKQLEELFRISTKWGFYLSLPIILLICFYSQELILIVFGRAYASDTLPLVILSTTHLIAAATGGVGFMLVMTDRQNHWLVLAMSSCGVNIGLNWLLIPHLGLSGAALATACSVSVLHIMALLQIKRSLGLWPYDRRFSKGLIAAGLTTIVLFLPRLINNIPPLMSLSLAVVASTFTFYGSLLILGLDSEDQEYTQLIRRRLGLKGRQESKQL